MSGFGGFGTGSNTGGLFGAKPPEQGSSTGFGVQTTSVTTSTTGLTFGGPTFSSGTALFGGQSQTQGFGFGVKPTTTAATTAPSGFTFGPNPATTASSTFGGFGTTSTVTFGTTPIILGTPKTTAGTGFTLPTATTSTTTAAPTFNFGVTSAAASTSAPLTFGLPNTTAAATTTAPTLSFGAPAAGTPVVTTSQTTGFTLNQPATTNSVTLGTPKTTGNLTFGTGTTSFGTAPTTAAPTFNFGTTTTSAPSFNFGASTTTTASGLGAGIFRTTTTTSATKTSGTGSLTTTTTIASVGLGGVDNTQTTQGLSGSGTLEPKQAKDHTLPDPILQTLNEFQNFTKQQKSISVEISHGSSKPLKKVQEDTEALESLLTTITSGLTRNAIAVDKLKTETAQGLHQAEMAQRNHETPPGLEYDNSAPADYFNDLVTKFETDTVRLRVQIEASEKHLRSLTQSSTISPQELTLAMRRLHETLIVLAARVQALHTTVQSQKEQYKNIRRVYFKDDTNIFENGTDQNRIKKQTIYSLRSLTGPTPFSETPGTGPPLHVDGLAMLACSTGASMPATSTNPSWMSPLQGTTNTGILPTSNFLGSPQLTDSSGFQLSKPPTGSKRNKR